MAYPILFNGVWMPLPQSEVGGVGHNLENVVPITKPKLYSLTGIVEFIIAQKLVERQWRAIAVSTDVAAYASQPTRAIGRISKERILIWLVSLHFSQKLIQVAHPQPCYVYYPTRGRSVQKSNSIGKKKRLPPYAMNHLEPSVCCSVSPLVPQFARCTVPIKSRSRKRNICSGIRAINKSK